MSDLNQVETAPEKQNDPIDESPTFATVKRIRHLTFAPTPIEIPKKPKEKSKKKKKKTPPTETQETDVTKEKTVTFHETKKKKKKSKHKREKSNGDTPKFGNKAMKLSNMSNFSEVMGGSTMIMDPENNKGENNEALDPDAVILSLPKNEKYKEDVMLGFNVTSYLRSKHIPIGNKVFYALVILVFIASCVMNLWDLILYARTTCPDDFSGVAMYIDFIIILFAKVGIFNYFTSELNANLTYDLKFPFIIPILSVGVIANLQLPLVLYNYNTCAMRSELLQLSFGYFVVDVAAILVGVAFFSAIVSMIFFQKFRVSKETKKMAKTVIYFIGISLMLLMNALFLFVSFTQTKYFSLTLITENITYWSLVVSGVIIFILRKKCNILVFRSLPEADEDLKQDEQSPKFIKPVKPEIVIHQPISVALNEPAHEVAIGIPIETPPHIKANTLHIHKQPLEQIEENSYENETDNSPTMTVFAAMKKAKDGEDGQASAYEGQDFTINCIQIPKNVIEEVEEGEQNNADIERGI